VGNHPFWHVAYHTLFCLDMYLSRNEASFRPPAFHRKNYQFLGKTPPPSQVAVIAGVPYEKPIIDGYLKACRKKASQAIAGETTDTLAGPSGFDWIPTSRLELHLYNIRHIQHHAGQLSARLRKSIGAGADWSATGWKPE
jgi:DinB superfamily